jgi:hypothetical protein
MIEVNKYRTMPYIALLIAHFRYKGVIPLFIFVLIRMYSAPIVKINVRAKATSANKPQYFTL